MKYMYEIVFGKIRNIFFSNLTKSYNQICIFFPRKYIWQKKFFEHHN